MEPRGGRKGVYAVAFQRILLSSLSPSQLLRTSPLGRAGLVLCDSSGVISWGFHNPSYRSVKDPGK